METAATAFLTVVGHGLWGSALIIGITALCIRMLNRGTRLNATTRHTLWGACLMGIVLLHGALLASALVPAGDGHTGAEIAPPLVTQSQEVSPLTTVARTESASPAATGPVLADPLRSAATAVESGSLSSLQLPALAGPFAVFLAIVWLVGLAFGFWRLAVAASWIQILKSRSTGVPSQTRARILERVSPLKRDMEIAVSAVGSPVAAGFRSPAVLMPEALLAEGEEETFDQVALHEVAHLQRGDDWALLIQRIAEALLWFNPAVRAVGRWMESEREAACDEWVVSATREPVTYARSLARMIELRLVGGGMMAAPGLAAKEGDIVSRVKSLLEQGANATTRELRGRAAVAIGLVALVGVLSVLSAPSIEIDWSDSSEDIVQVASVADRPGLPPLPPLPPLPGLAPLAPLAPLADRSAGPERPDAPAVADFPAVADVPGVPDIPAAPEARKAGPAPPAASAFTPVTSVPALGSDPASSPAPALRTGPSGANLTVSGWLRFLKIAKNIPSEGDRARLLVDAAGRMPSDEQVHAGFLDAARSIPSSAGKKRVLTAYLRGHSPKGEIALDLIRTAMTLPGSSDRSRMLLAIGQGVEQTAEIRSALLDAVDRLPSSSDRERVLRALTN